MEALEAQFENNKYSTNGYIQLVHGLWSHPNETYGELLITGSVKNSQAFMATGQAIGLACMFAPLILIAIPSALIDPTNDKALPDFYSFFISSAAAFIVLMVLFYLFCACLSALGATMGYLLRENDASITDGFTLLCYTWGLICLCIGIPVCGGLISLIIQIRNIYVAMKVTYQLPFWKASLVSVFITTLIAFIGLSVYLAEHPING